MPSPSNTRRYRQMLAAIHRDRGARCEACGTSARHVHHVIPIRQTGINDELAYEPANLLIMCDNCHMLMHPLIRKTDWLLIRRQRGAALRG